jgi:hypothetical protein
MNCVDAGRAITPKRRGPRFELKPKHHHVEVFRRGADPDGEGVAAIRRMGPTRALARA